MDYHVENVYLEVSSMQDWMALTLNEASVASNELSALHLGIVSVAGAGSGVLQTASAHALETRALTVGEAPNL